MEVIALVKRKEYLHRLIQWKDEQLIKVVTGIRRCGKSTMLMQYQEWLKANNISDEQIISINFEDLEYEELQDYQKLYDYLKHRLCKGKMTYIFLDEIQEVKDWEKCINSLRVNEEYDFDIYITGSNAKLLSGELSTYLAGRYVEFVIYPFSFKEFLETLKSIQQDVSTREAFQKYVKFGGMPFLYNLAFEEEASLQYLKDIYSSIILKDITQRNKIRDTDMLERVISYLIMNVGNNFSATSISKFFKSENRKVSVETILNYIKAAEESFLIYRVSRDDLIGKKVLNVNEKYYIADHGMREAILGSNQRDINQIFENIIYLELLRKDYNVRVGKVDNLEVDFVCTKGNEKIYVQVAYLLASSETIEREFTSLEKIGDNYPKYVISMDEFDMSRNGIKHINIIEFLIS